MGLAYPSDEFGLTSVPGVWIAGNVRNILGQVVHAAGKGTSAAARLNMELVMEDVAIACGQRKAAID